MSLTPKQDRFVQEYLVDYNGQQAALRAGYSKKTARQQACRLLTKANIQRALTKQKAAIAERAEITSGMVLRAAAQIAFSDMGDVANWNQFAVMLKDSDELPPEIRRTIKKVKQGAHGVEVEFYDKNRAIQLLANFFGLTQDLAPKVEIQIITGVPRLSHPPAKGPPVIDVEKVG